LCPAKFHFALTDVDERMGSAMELPHPEGVKTFEATGWRFHLDIFVFSALFCG